MLTPSQQGTRSQRVFLISEIGALPALSRLRSTSPGAGSAQVAVDGLAADAEFLGQRRLLLSGGGAFLQLRGLVGVQGGLAAGVDAALLCRRDALALAFQDQRTFKLGERARSV